MSVTGRVIGPGAATSLLARAMAAARSALRPWTVGMWTPVEGSLSTVTMFGPPGPPATGSPLPSTRFVAVGVTTVVMVGRTPTVGDGTSFAVAGDLPVFWLAAGGGVTFL